MRSLWHKPRIHKCIARQIYRRSVYSCHSSLPALQHSIIWQLRRLKLQRVHLCMSCENGCYTRFLQCGQTRTRRWKRPQRHYKGDQHRRIRNEPKVHWGWTVHVPQLTTENDIRGREPGDRAILQAIVRQDGTVSDSTFFLGLAVGQGRPRRLRLFNFLHK